MTGLFAPYVESTLTNKHLSPFALYAKIDAYYDGNSVYDGPELHAYILGKGIEALKPIRDVANRSVEFYATKIIPGNVEVVTDNNKLKEAIKQVLKWSNFDGQRTLFMRDLAKYGDLFLKMVVSDDKVYFESIPCKYVKDFEENARGILQNIRIEIPQVDATGANIYFVEYWQPDYFSTWISSQPDVPLDQLGEPGEYGMTSALGIDFVPFVHVKFKDVGHERGEGCFTHAMDKIDEANRQATNLAEMVFKNAEGVWVEQSQQFDKDGKPMAPAPIRDRSGNITSNLQLSKNAFMQMPAGTELISTIPQINYEAVRNIANDMVVELEQDLPELKYYSLQAGAHLSGKAIGMLLAGAIDRAQEAGSNFKQALVRACQITLTMGIEGGVLDSSLGSYVNGDFDHDFSFGQYFQPDSLDKATELGAMVTAGIELDVAMKIAGYSQEEIDAEMAAKKAADALAAKKAAANPPPIAPISQQEGQGGVQGAPIDITTALNAAKAKRAAKKQIPVAK
jgi:hypothetical protein